MAVKKFNISPMMKVRNFRPKPAQSFDKSPDGLGFAPEYMGKREGIGINKIRYGKNFSQGTGVCKKCDKFTGETGTNGEHCSLPVNEHCQQ